MFRVPEIYNFPVRHNPVPLHCPTSDGTGASPEASGVARQFLIKGGKIPRPFFN